MGDKDMSSTCGFHYFEYFVARDKGEMTKEKFSAWFDENCAKCFYMCEICMYGED